MTSIFGPILDGSRIDQAVADTIELWLPTYLVELERQNGRPPGRIKPPGAPSIVASLDTTIQQNPPAVLVVSASLDGQPERIEDGALLADWATVIGVIVQDTQPLEVLKKARLYIAAIRALILDKQDLGLGDTVLGIDWFDEDPNEGPTEAQRSLAVAIAGVRIHTQHVGGGAGGPASPIPTPDPEAPDAPEVLTTDLILTATTEP